MKVNQCMKRNVVSISNTTTLGEVARMLVQKHIGLLPVIDAENKLVGVIGLAEILQLFLPDFVQLVDNLDFVHNFGKWEQIRIAPEERRRPVSEIMSEPVVVEQNEGLLRAYTMLLKHEIYDLLVVDVDGKLVGIASRVDVGTTFLSQWGTAPLNPEDFS